MRILHVLNCVSNKGNGIVNTAVDLAIQQASQGQRVAVASGGEGYEAFLEGHDVSHLVLPKQPRWPWEWISASIALHRIIADFKPDVVHAHMRTSLLLAWLMSKLHRFALVAHYQNVHEPQSFILGLAQRVIAVSQSVADTIESQGIPKAKIRVVLNRTLNSPRQPPLSDISAVPLANPSILTVCGMYYRKGISELITAFEIAGTSYPDAHLYLVGDGAQREVFEQLARRSSVGNRIHFEGFQRTPQAYMLSADIFVLASHRESFGIVLIEARQAGCAIIASDIDGVAEALEGGRAGMLVPPRDPASLAEALMKLLGSENDRRALADAALVGVEKFTVTSLAAEVQDIYNEIVDVRDPVSKPEPALLDTRSLR